MMTPPLPDLHARLAALTPQQRALLDTQIRTQPVPPPSEIPGRPTPDRSPLTPIQRRFWLGEQLEPGTAQNNIHVPLALREVPELDRLRAAIRSLHERHEILRTSIRVEAGRADQRITDSVEPRFEASDLRQLSAETAEAKALAVGNAIRSQVFDLARPPLARFHLVLLPDRAVLHLVIHHILVDGWGARLLIRALAAAYEGRDEIPPVPYGDYAAWLDDRLGRGEFQPHLTYWRNLLTGVPPRLELPTDFPRGPVRGGRGARASLAIGPAVTAQVRTVAREIGGTVFMPLLAVYQLLLARLAGQDDVVVGVPVAGRTTPEEEQILGCFLNTLPLRLRFDGTESFHEILARVRESVLGGVEHQAFPFDRLVEELNPERSLSHAPVFQVLFNMVNFPDAGVDSFATVAARGDDTAVTAKFDLTLYAADEGPEGIRLTATYDPDLFAAERIAEVLRQYEGLLVQCLSSAERPVREHTLVTASARALLPDPRAPLGKAYPGSVPELLHRQATVAPARVAIESAAGQWSYQELDDAAGRIAAALLANGVGRGEVVGVYATRTAALVPALLGVLRAGAAFCVLDAAYPVERLEQYVEIGRPRMLLCTEGSGEPSSQLCRSGGRPLKAMHVPATPAGLLVSPIGEFAPAPCVEIGADDLAYLSFTSGTTGVPKAVLGRHGSLTHFVPWRVARFGLTQDDRFSMLSGLSHDPLHREVLLPVQIGARICVPPPDHVTDGTRFGAWLPNAAVTIAHLTPGMTKLLAHVDGSLPELRWAFFVGEMLHWADVARLRRVAPNAGVVNQYGTTETQQALGYHVVPLPPHGPVDRPAGGLEVLPAGRGLPDVQLLVVTAGGGQAGIGEFGEVCVRSPHIALGYLPGHREDRFVGNPITGDSADCLYRTGDLGRYLPDGSVILSGRADGQVKVRGFRVETTEVAAALVEIPGVQDAVVVLRSDEGEGGEDAVPQLVGYVVLEGSPGARPSPGALRTALRVRLPDYMVPAAIVEIAAIPITPNGKLDRGALPVPATAPSAWGTALELPANAVEAVLLNLWRSVLRQPRLGVTDSFFDAGGHSLLATQLTAKTCQLFRCEVPLRCLFERPRIREFAAALVERETRPGLFEQIAQLVLRVEAMAGDESRGSGAGMPRGAA